MNRCLQKYCFRRKPRHGERARLLWFSGGNRRLAQSGFRFLFSYNDYVHPAIERATGFSAVAGDGMIFAVTTRG